MWFQQDGATPHTARISISLLREHFTARLMSLRVARKLTRFSTLCFYGNILNPWYIPIVQEPSMSWKTIFIMVSSSFTCKCCTKWTKTTDFDSSNALSRTVTTFCFIIVLIKATPPPHPVTYVSTHLTIVKVWYW